MLPAGIVANVVAIDTAVRCGTGLAAGVEAAAAIVIVDIGDKVLAVMFIRPLSRIVAKDGGVEECLVH